MRASRLLSILLLLQTRGRVSADTLAEEADVSVRTIYRDVDQLSAAGVPVYAERGRAGGFRLLDGWRTRLTGLTASEAQALFLTGLPGPAAELGLGEAMAAAQLKLLAAMPEGWQENARRVGARFHLDPIDWFRSPAPSGHLKDLADSVWRERRVWVRYRSWTHTTEREIDPLGLVLKAGIWYLAARAGGKLRNFRVASIRKLRKLDAPFTRPREFDLAQYWTESTKRFERELYRETARVRVSPRGLAHLRTLSPALAEAVDGAGKAARSARWRRLVIPIESVEHAAGQLLRLGAEIEVLEPPDLRERMAATARRLADLYRGPVRLARPA
jgi:predicted DNA-binding transcriptional regulator YafY